MSAAAPASTSSEDVAQRLRQDIVEGHYPPESRLAMKALCSHYGVGTSPLREALQRLAGEGFVHVFGQRGFRVPPLSMADWQDLTELRLLVEAAALKQALQRGGDAWEAGIVAAFHQLEKQAGRIQQADPAALRAYDRVHRAFHHALYAAASPRLLDLQGKLFDQAFRYRQFLHHEALSPRDVVDEHRALMQAVLARGPQPAEAAVRRHLGLTQGPAQRGLAQAPAQRGPKAGGAPA
jgi:DNA-binding GntR family transcriptional regulator